jgi:hypothetical protein
VRIHFLSLGTKIASFDVDFNAAYCSMTAASASASALCQGGLSVDIKQASDEIIT